MERRLANLREYMASSNLDACIFTSHHNILYFCDFMAHDWGRPSGLYINHDNAVLITPYAGGLEPYRRSYSKNLTFTDWHQDNFFFAVKEIAGNSTKIGIEFDHVTYHRFNQFAQALQGAQIRDVSDATMNMRMIKSDEEIERVRNGVRIADIGDEMFRGTIKEGITEFELASEVTQTLEREICRTYPHQQIRDVWTWVISGESTDSGHNSNSSRKINAGDIISFNAFPTIGGYYCALERSFAYKYMPEPILKMWESLTEVQDRGVELLQPGARCSDIAIELNELMKERGIWEGKNSGFGYSLGIMGTYYGREAGLELREYNNRILQPNMILSMQVSISIPNTGGIRDFDCIVITEKDSEVLTKAPRGPKHCILDNEPGIQST